MNGGAVRGTSRGSGEVETLRAEHTRLPRFNTKCGLKKQSQPLIDFSHRVAHVLFAATRTGGTAGNLIQ